MDAADWIALYGAVVAIGVAAFQVGTHFRDNPRIAVTASFSYSASSEDRQSTTRGTLRRVERDGDVLTEEMLISFNVVNHGRRAVQISSVCCEELQDMDSSIRLRRVGLLSKPVFYLLKQGAGRALPGRRATEGVRCGSHESTAYRRIGLGSVAWGVRDRIGAE